MEDVHDKIILDYYISIEVENIGLCVYVRNKIRHLWQGMKGREGRTM